MKSSNIQTAPVDVSTPVVNKNKKPIAADVLKVLLSQIQQDDETVHFYHVIDGELFSVYVENNYLSLLSG